VRGQDRQSSELFSYVGIENKLRSDHPFRAIKTLVDEALDSLSVELQAIYADTLGQPSIPPEHLVRAMLLQAFYSVRSERQLTERLEFDLLFRWFVGLSADEPAWDASTFSKNRERLLAGQIAAQFLYGLSPPIISSACPSSSARARYDDSTNGLSANRPLADHRS
jgi:transposase